MSEENKALLKLSYPKWFLVVLPAFLFCFLVVFALVTNYYSSGGFSWVELGAITFFLGISLLWLWIIPFIYSSVIATDSGLEVAKPLRRRQKFAWDEIVKVSRPRWNIPREFVYVFSKSGRRIILLRGMEGFPDLLELIQSKAPNLSSKRVSQELWPENLSWKKVWLTIVGLFAAYLILKLIFVLKFGD